MGLIITKNRERKEVLSYGYNFNCLDCPGAGLSFPCDKDGNIFMADLVEAGINNLNHAKANIGVLYDKPHVQQYVNRYTEHAEGTCKCGKTVVLSDSLDNECENCHRIYNLCGQELKPRDQWEENMDYDY